MISTEYVSDEKIVINVIYLILFQLDVQIFTIVYIWNLVLSVCDVLKNRTYYIFNKQYTKEERYEKVDEIFTQMERD